MNTEDSMARRIVDLENRLRESERLRAIDQALYEARVRDVEVARLHAMRSGMSPRAAVEWVRKRQPGLFFRVDLRLVKEDDR